MQSKEYKYFAFISYNSSDTRWGKRLQRKLEHYRMPATLCQQRGWKRKPIAPVFFAPTDIQPGELSNELKGRLESARHLIVICSPRSARSEWVGREIEYFASLGRKENVHLFIVDGVPHSGNPETECFNPAIERAGLGDVLGANVHEKVSRWAWVNRERAYVQMVTKLLGVEFDTLWQRHRRQLRMRLLSLAFLAALLLSAFAALWAFTRPFDSELTCKDVSGASQLPPLHEAVVKVWLNEDHPVPVGSPMDDAAQKAATEVKTDTLHHGTQLQFRNIPHAFLGQLVRITVQAPDFLPLDTIVRLDRKLQLPLQRDPEVYGHVQFTLLRSDTSIYPHQLLSINGQRVTTDADGEVDFLMPFAKQRRYYVVEAPFPLESDTLFMPISEDAVLLAR